MTVADNARNQAISLEAKKDALTQRQSGDWKISFTVQGIDMDPRLTQAAMGSRFAMVLVEIGEDELPIQRPAKETPNDRRLADKQPEPTPPARAKLDWREVQPAAQAGIRCAEPSFQAFLQEEHYPHWTNSKLDAAVCVRLICGVESRSELATNQKSRVIWHQLDTAYQAWKALEHA